MKGQVQLVTKSGRVDVIGYYVDKRRFVIEEVIFFLEEDRKVPLKINADILKRFPGQLETIMRVVEEDGFTIYQVIDEKSDLRGKDDD